MCPGRPETPPHEAPASGQDGHDPERFGPEEFKRRRGLLHADPGLDPVDMATLADIARAIERESVRQYTWLAEVMERRGEPATAAAFRTMLEEERRHVAAVERWAAATVDTPPRVAGPAVEWQLPEDLAGAWDEVSGSALLTPYRAFAVAVENEQRAFAFYAYLAANADDAHVRTEAERLGAEELRHAALFRRWRRRAYHRERRGPRPEPQRIESVAQLRDLLAQHEAAINGTGPAQKSLEALADELESIMATADGELFEQAATAMETVIRRIARGSAQERRADPC